MNSGASAPATKPPSPKTEGEKPKEKGPVKVSLTFPRHAVEGEGVNAVDYIIGKRIVGQAAGLSAFVLTKEYHPDWTKFPTGNNATVTVTLDDTGRVIAIGVAATL